MVKIYVEGGGDSAALKTVCREGFSKFLSKAGLAGVCLVSWLVAVVQMLLTRSAPLCAAARSLCYTLIDPAKVLGASPWAKRFIEALQAEMGR